MDPAFKRSCDFVPFMMDLLQGNNPQKKNWIETNPFLIHATGVCSLLFTYFYLGFIPLTTSIRFHRQALAAERGDITAVTCENCTVGFSQDSIVKLIQAAGKPTSKVDSVHFQVFSFA